MAYNDLTNGKYESLGDKAISHPLQQDSYNFIMYAVERGGFFDKSLEKEKKKLHLLQKLLWFSNKKYMLWD